MREFSESEILQDARSRLAELLPGHFTLGDATIDQGGPADGPDAIWQLQEQNSGYGLILVEARGSFTPRDVTRLRERLSGPVWRLMRDPTVLVVAPWLSPRTRSLIEESGYSYLDLTGNVSFRIDRPAVYIKLQGADRDPNPRPKTQAGLHGPKARRLVRLLVDAMPPQRSTDLAKAGGLTPGYVSKLLESLDDQALVERDRRGVVGSVDWPSLLAAGAARYDLLRNNLATTFVAQDGAPALYARISRDDARPDVVVTGSFAASRIAQVAAPVQLVMYADDQEEVRRFGRLLPTDRGADVVLLRPEDPAQVIATRTVDGMRHVDLSQLVLDCLSGNGRLPEEGQAVLAWMRAHEADWRLDKLPVLDRRD
jgi:DNA-binding MarR family transcriptional regulator